MALNIDGAALGLASEFGVPAIDGADPSVLNLPALGPDQSLRLSVPAGSPVPEYALGFDLYLEEPSGSFVGLLQTGDGDGDIFLRDNGDGTAGVGISGVYDGAVAYDTWTRLVLTFTEDAGETVLRKYIDGALVGTQNLGVTDRFAIDPDLGLRLFTDNDGETAPLTVSSVYYSPGAAAPADVEAVLATIPDADAAGFFPAAPLSGAVELNFAGESLAPRYGTADVLLEGFNFGTPVMVGGSTIARPSQLGIDAPGGDIPVLDYSAFGPEERVAVRIPIESTDLSSYTAVWDIYIDDATSGFQALFQTSSSNTDDGELFINADGGLGINGQYDGRVPTGAWTRIAITVEDAGDGSATLTKYIDGVEVGSQTVEAARYTLQSNGLVPLLTDNNNETGTGALAHFAIAPNVLSAEEVAALGPVDADGPFDPPEPKVSDETIEPVRLTDQLGSQLGALFTSGEAAVEGLTFQNAFSFRIVPDGGSADGFTFQLQSPDGDDPLLGGAGGDLGLPLVPTSGTNPVVAVAFDTFVNGPEPSDNSIRIIAGGDANTTPLAVVEAPVQLDSGDTYFAWVDYDGANLSVFIAETDEKPATPVLSEPVDLGAILGDTAIFGFTGTTGGVTSVHDILSWDLSTNDAAAPSGQLLDAERNVVDLFGTATRLPEIVFDPDAPLQAGFDGYQPTAEFGFTDVSLTDVTASPEVVPDLLVSPTDEDRTFDLAAGFGEGASGFEVTNSNGEAVSATIDDGILTLAFNEFGLSDLVVTATSATGETLTDNVRVRVAGENAYTFAILPDTQNYPAQPAIAQTFFNMTNWLADNAEGKGIGFVTHVGDIVDFNTPEEFEVALAAMDVLREADVPFSVLPGNHDMGDGGSANRRFTDPYNDAFSVTYMSEDPTFAGVYDQQPDRYDSNYHLWDAPDGTGWIILNLEFGHRDDVMRWADDVLTEYGDRKAFVLTHSYNNFDGRHDSLGSPLNAEPAGYNYGISDDPEGAWDGETLWREVIDRHPNVVFTAGGHIFGDGAETLISTNDFGNDVYQFLVNYQNGVSREITGAGDPDAGGNGGNGAIRLVTVDPDNDTVFTETYFTELDTYLTDTREGEELNRDGLTGPYPGHQETIKNANTGVREAETIAEAGDDQVVAAEAGEKSVSVTLSADKTIDQRGDVTAYVWTDEDGTVLGEGRETTVDLAAGVNDVTLTVETARGVSHSDHTRVIVETDETFFTETFDDGDADGWVQPGEADGALERLTALGTDLDLGLPSLTGAAQVPLAITFDSHWRPEDTQTALLQVSFDGGDPVTLLRYDSSNTADDGSNQNETVSLDVLAPVTAETVQVIWRMETAGNDWFWAIDNVEIAADGTAVVSENFDSLASALQPAADENIPPDVLGWTQTPPEDWSIDTPDTVPQGATEWQGWSFTTPEFWVAADTQDRANFDKGTGVFAVADPDEWDDFGDGSQTNTDYETDLLSPVIDLTPFTDGGDGTPVEAASVMEIAALSPNQTFQLTPTATGTVNEFTLIYDLFVEEGQSTFTSLFQTDLANSSDGELFLRNNGDGTAGIGISGQYDGAFDYATWNRVAFTFSLEGNAQILSKYIDGALVGTQTVDEDITDGTRWQFEGEDGFLLFSDESGETSDVALNAFTFTPGALTAEEIAALGGPDVDGPLNTAPDADAVQLNFDAPVDSADFGSAAIEFTDGGTNDRSFYVKGSANSRAPGNGLDAPTAALFDESNGADNIFVREGASYGDVILEATLQSLDDDTMGVVWRYDEATGDHYRLEMNNQENVRRMVRVEDGTETIIAEEAGGYTFYDAIDVRVTAIGGTFTVSLDGVPLFDGPVTDAGPLGQGSVGFFASDMDGAIFDDMTVRAPHDEAVAGPGQRLIDYDGDGMEEVTIDARLSVGETTVTGGGLDETAPTATTTVETGTTVFTVTAGEISDEVAVEVVSGEKLIAADQFEDGDFDGWTIIDTTEIGGPADWAVVDGKLVERSGASSRELTFAGADNPDPYQRGWSPLGDGVFALHKGTYALWEENQALENYAIEATLEVPTEGGVGFMLNYVDEDNYYKLEIDARANLTTMVKVVDGYESYLGRVRTVYTPDEEFRLVAERVDEAFQVTIDGHEIFAYALEDDDLGAGAAGVYAWGAAGASFDDVAIIDLSDEGETRVVDAGAASEEFAFDGGKLIIEGFDTAAADRDEATADTLRFQFGGEEVALSAVDQIIDFAARIETDGDGDTDALVSENGDLAFVLSRNADGSIADGILLRGVVTTPDHTGANDGLNLSDLTEAGADMFTMFADESDLF